jgi:hypothetical protein
MALSQVNADLLKSFGISQYADSQMDDHHDIATWLIDVANALKNGDTSKVCTSGSIRLINASTGMLNIYIQIDGERKFKSLVIGGEFLVSFDIEKSEITEVHVNELTNFSLAHKDNTTELEDELEFIIEEDFELTDQGQSFVNYFFEDPEWLKCLNELVFYKPR